LVLLIMVMAQSLQYRASRVNDLESAIAEVQDEAKRVQKLREQVEETSEAASFLTRRRAESPMAIELLAEVTKILPDDTYLDRLVISPDGVLMQGKSSNAQQLIEVVNKSEAFDDAAFRGSTRLDAASGLEIFEINTQVGSGGAP
jgi:general secretion pathway protein L